MDSDDDAAKGEKERAAGADFFISHTRVDREWAEWIAWELEAAGYRVLVQAWDFTAGSNFVREMHRAAMTAARTVAVLSPAYLTSAYAEAAWQAAWNADPSGADGKLLAVRVEDCPQPGLLGQLVGVDLFAVDRSTARQRLLAAATRTRLRPAHSPTFPGGRRAHTGYPPPGFPGPTRGWEAVWQPGRSPFPGLDAFDASRAMVFKGREEDTRLLADSLTRPGGDGSGLVVVVGPSGCGKSSLVAAGLVPMMAQDPNWLAVPALVPGGRPLAALAEALTEAGRQHDLAWEADELADRLAEPGAVVEVARELLAAVQARRLLLVIDQAEELLVRTCAAGRAEFLALLAEASAGPVRVVATLRSEYLDQLIEEATPVRLRVRTEAVHPLPRHLLPLVITGPASLAGLTVEDELVARIVADTGDGHGLPLLAYTLQRLHAHANQVGTAVLSAALYDAIGGVRGALVDHADAAVAEASAATGRSNEQVLASLVHLIGVDTEGRPTRRRVPLDHLMVPVRAALTPFVVRRLLTVDAVPGGPATVEVSHERLLTAWPPLATAIAVASDRLRQRSQAETAAEDWQRRGRPATRLWNLGLATAALTAVGSEELTPTARVFLTASRRRAQRRLAGAFIVLIVLLLVATSFGVTAYIQGGAADRQRYTAEARRRTAVVDRLLNLADTTRSADPTAALRLAVAAGTLAADEDTTARIRGNLLVTLAGVPALTATLVGHTGPVTAVAFGSGGLLATGSEDGTVRLWDTSDSRRIHQIGIPLTGHTGTVYAVAFGPGGLLATGGLDGTVRLWDTSSSQHAHQIDRPLTGHNGPVFTVAFGSGGLLATGGFDSTVRLWDASDPQRVRQVGAPLTGHTFPVTAVMFGPGGLLATGSADKTVRLWITSNPQHVRPVDAPLTGHTNSVNTVAFGPDGLLATGGVDSTVRLWDISDPQRVREVGPPLTGHTDEVRALTFGPGGMLATASSDKTVRLWGTSDPQHVRSLGTSLTGHTDQVNAVGFSSGGLLATGSADGTVRLWNTSDPQRVHPLGQPLVNHGGPVTALAFGSSGLLATGNADGTVRLWNRSDPWRVREVGPPLTGHTGTVHAVAFGPGGLLASVGGTDSMVRLWDVSDPQRARLVGEPLTGHTNSVNTVAFRPDGLLATGSDDRTVRLWDTSNPQRVRQVGVPLTGHTNSVNTVTFRPDGLLATGSSDSTVRLWDTSDRVHVHAAGPALSGHTFPVNAVAFGPGGLLATGSADRTVRLWDVADPQRARLAGEPLTGHSDSVSAVAFEPGGLLLVTSGDDKAHLWDTSDPQDVHQIGQPLTGHALPVNAVAFGPDGLLATASSDATMRLWDTRDLGSLREHTFEVACQLAGRGLAEPEWRQYVSGTNDDPYRESCRDRRPTG
ncbi:TIR domain-containing protein [Frankia sp. Cpl3]|nr:TIR domain-containing protein [Frankia sp. Cpl3]